MYVNGSGPVVPVSETISRGTGPATWHKGAMSRRFDGKDDTPTTTAAVHKPATSVSHGS